jgi:hypothetical protein
MGHQYFDFMSKSDFESASYWPDPSFLLALSASAVSTLNKKCLGPTASKNQKTTGLIERFTATSVCTASTLTAKPDASTPNTRKLPAITLPSTTTISSKSTVQSDAQVCPSCLHKNVVFDNGNLIPSVPGTRSLRSSHFHLCRSNYSQALWCWTKRDVRFQAVS